MQILPAITTITGAEWKKKVKEAKKLKLKEVALFPTCLNQQARKELYQLLKATGIKTIPFVHLRSDMELWELDYLKDHYQTKVFNTHTQREHPFVYNCQKYQKLIYIENVVQPLDEAEIKEFAGICLDFSHLENDRLLHRATYKHNIKMIEKYQPGCVHISAIKPNLMPDEEAKVKYSSHLLKDLSELDYLKKYPLSYFVSPIAIELENSLEEQLKVKDYIVDLLRSRS